MDVIDVETLKNLRVVFIIATMFGLMLWVELRDRKKYPKELKDRRVNDRRKSRRYY